MKSFCRGSRGAVFSKSAPLADLYENAVLYKENFVKKVNNFSY
jgi:hypothetical protein